MKNTVAIIGSNPRTRGEFNFERTDCDVWLFNEAISNPANTWAKRADAVFQMHDPAIWRNPANRNDPGHAAWLTSQTVSEIWMQEQYPDVPMSRAYPLQEILKLGMMTKEFLNSSVSLAMALAGYLGYTRVEVYGVAMETNTEYGAQRSGVAWWLGWLEGRGVSVYFADPTFESPIYGYGGEVVIPYERFGERIAELTPAYEKLSSAYSGSLIDTRRAMQAFEQDSSGTNEKALYEAVHRQVTLCEQLGTVDGAMQENMRYKERADIMLKASENFLFSRQEFESGSKTNLERAKDKNTLFISLGTQLEMCHRTVMNAPKGSKKRADLVNTYWKIATEYFKVKNAESVFKGAANENFNYMAWLDKRIHAAGGAKSEAVLLESMANDNMVSPVEA